MGFILEYLRGKDFTSPTQIGKAYGKIVNNPDLHSSWASPKCLKLVAEGKLIRNKKGWYKLK